MTTVSPDLTEVKMVNQPVPIPESIMSPTKSTQTPTISILLTSFVDSSFFFFSPMLFGPPYYIIVQPT